MFNVRVRMDGTRSTFLLNTLTDAQLVVPEAIVELLERADAGEFDGMPKDESAFATYASPEESEALAVLQNTGFLVVNRDEERHALARYLDDVKSDRTELHITLLTTLQCNFACDYCYQGDHSEYIDSTGRMSLETVAKVMTWVERELDRVRPERLGLTFLGGEPLLNLPAMYEIAERSYAVSRTRGVTIHVNLITNGLLLTPEVVDRLVPYGLNAVKITLDGDRTSHDRMRPLRGGQGTFDRIVENMRRVAGKCRIQIGGNFDESTIDSYPALLEYLNAQEFASSIATVNFKPVIRAEPRLPKGAIPLMPVKASSRHLNGTCMTSTGSGVNHTACGALDQKSADLREQTARLGFHTQDGLHIGPCHVHKRHAHTVGPDGSLYACPGFTGQLAQSIGHVDDRVERHQEITRRQFDRLAPWKDCGDCAFIPVCAGGCVAASYAQLGDMTKPNCHKTSLEAAVVSIARSATERLQTQSL